MLAAVTHQQRCLVHVLTLFLETDSTGYLEIRESIHLRLSQQRLFECIDILSFQLFIDVDDMLQLIEEPLVDLRQLMDMFDRIFRQMHGLRDHEDTLVCRLAQGCVDIGNLQFLVLHESVHSLSDHTESFLDGLFKGTSDSHHLTHRLHRRPQFLIDPMELREVPAGNLAHHVVEGRFEEGRCGLRHRVFQFEESVTHTQLCSYKGQRIASSLRGQGRRTRQTGIYLNHTIVFRLGVEGILHVTLADNTDMTDNLDSQRTQLMILRIGERLRRSHHNRLSRMDAQRVEILHITDGDTVIIAITHHLVFYFLPAFQRFLYENLRRERERFLCQAVEFLLIVAEA